MFEWRKATVAELELEGSLLVQDGNHGNDRPRPEEFSHTGAVFVRAADIHSGRVSFDRASRIDDTALARIRKGHGRPGDSLLTHKGTVGKVAYVGLDAPTFVCSPQTTFWRSLDHDAIDPRFIYFLLQSPVFVSQLNAQKDETDMAPYVSLTQQRRLELTLPSLPEQIAIAEVLGALDDKIAANNGLLGSLSKVGRALFEQAVRLDSVCTPLGSIALNVAGKYLPKNSYVEDGKYFVYGSNSVMGRHDEWNVAGPFAVLAKIGSYCGNLRWSEQSAWVNNNASAIVPRDQVSPWILRYALAEIDMTPHRAGTGQPYIRMESLFAAPIVTPAGATAQNLSRTLAGISEIEVVATESNRTLAATRDALLPQLMSGKLRVKDAESLVADAV